MHRRALSRRLGAIAALGLAGCVNRASDAGPGTDGADGTDGAAADSNSTDDEDPATDVDDGRSADAPPTVEDWPTYGADRGHRGVRPAGTGPEAGEVAWSAIGDAPTVLCSPTVRDGTVYTGSASDTVHAVDAGTGEAVWTHETGEYVEVAPAVRDGTVYTADSNGVVYALDAADGTEEWTHDTGRNLHSRALVVDDGTVFVGTAGTMPAVVSGDTDGSKAGQVLALDAATGEVDWTFEGPDDWFTGPASGGGRVYVGNHTGDVVALDPGSGEPVWTWHPAPRDDVAGDEERVAHAAVLAPPTYADGTVYVPVHALGRVAALDAASGEVEWWRTLEAPNVKSSPAVDGDRVYVGSHAVRAAAPDGAEYGGGGGDGEGTDAGSGTPTPTRTRTPTPTSTPESGTHGKLYALSRDDGSTVWLTETRYDFRSSPAVVGEKVYVGGGDGLLAVARSDGSERWRVQFDDFVYSSPAVVDGRAYVGSADGSLYCVE